MPSPKAGAWGSLRGVFGSRLAGLWLLLCTPVAARRFPELQAYGQQGAPTFAPPNCSSTSNAGCLPKVGYDREATFALNNDTVLRTLFPATDLSGACALTGCLRLPQPTAVKVEASTVAEAQHTRRTDLIKEGGTAFSLSLSLAKASVSWVDYDADGDADLFITSSSTLFLYKNTLVESGISETVSFEDVAASTQVSNAPSSVTGDSSVKDCFLSDFFGLYNDAEWGDFDGDGLIDLVLVSEADDWVLRNTGNGTFAFHVSLDSGTGQEAAFADYDNDGDLDLAIVRPDLSSTNPSRSFLMENIGKPGSRPPQFTQNQADVSNPVTKRDGAAISTAEDRTLVLGNGVAWADVDGDGFVDLLIFTPANKSNALYMNLGNDCTQAGDNHACTWRGFELMTGSALAQPPLVDAHWGTFADVDGDGFLDLFVANVGAANAFYANQNGSFVVARASEFSPNSIASSLQAHFADYDGDGDLDLFVINSDDANELYQNVFGTFTKSLSGEASRGSKKSFAAAFADYDNDGDLDLFVANQPTTVSGSNLNSDIIEFDHEGDFTAVSSGAVVSTVSASVNVAWADVDGDGDLDLLIVNKESTNELYLNVAGEHRQVEFELVSTGPIATDSAVSSAAAWEDFSGDGYPDLAVANDGELSFLYVNDGLGVLSRVDTSGFFNATDPSTGVCWGDFDSDGQPDLLVTNTGAPNRLYRNIGSNAFKDVAQTAGIAGTSDKTKSSGCAIADFNNDGHLDLLIVNNDGSQTNELWVNGGQGGNSTTFSAYSLGTISTDQGPPGSTGSKACAWADFDRDGYIDVIIVNRDHENFLYRNEGPSGTASENYKLTRVLPAKLPRVTNKELSYNHDAQWGDVDGDGWPDLFVVNEGVNLLYYNNRDGSFSDPLSSSSPISTDSDTKSRAAAFGDFDGDGDLDLLLVNDGASNRLYVYSHCAQGARPNSRTGCFDCPSYSRRSSNVDVCYECEPDFITGGLNQEARCLFACPVGLARPTDADQCALCPAGHLYNSNIDRTIDQLSPRCQPCPVGHVADGATPAIAACFPCGAGQFAPNTTMATCVECSPGTYTDGATAQSACINCPLGGFCSSTGVFISFIKCPVGSYSSTPAASSNTTCLSCSAGKFNPKEGQDAEVDCEQCRPGSFTSIDRQPECTLCSPGEYQPDFEQTACLTCTAGSFCPQASPLPVPCAVGSFSNTPGLHNQSQCEPCLAGTFCITRSTGPISCPAGQYTDQDEQEVCKLCEPGKFQPDSGATGCINCPPGAYCPLGSVREVSCELGSYDNSSGVLFHQSNCSACPLGSFCPIGSLAPSVCDPGSYARFTRMGACEPCEIGKYQSGYNATVCETCPDGHYCPRGSSSPVPCEPGSFHSTSASISQKCGQRLTDSQGNLHGQMHCDVVESTDAGAETTVRGESEQAACQPCPAGSYCPLGASNSTLCKPGSYQPEASKGSCILCSAGHFQRNFGQTACIDCPPGAYCQEGATREVSCEAGSFANSVGLLSDQPQCTSCPVGSHCPIGATAPTPCKPGYYTDDFESETCTACEHGKFQDASNSTACKVCERGHYCPAASATSLPCPGGTYNDDTFNVTYRFVNRGIGDGPSNYSCGGVFPHADSPSLANKCDLGPINSAESLANNTLYFYGIWEETQCRDCPKGHECPEGSVIPSRCAKGSYADSTALSVCTLCAAGTFQSAIGSSECELCPRGFFCPEGGTSPTPCPDGYFGGSNGSQSATDCTLCQRGRQCPRGATEEQDCLPGTFAPIASTVTCTLCAAGTYQDGHQATACKDCDVGAYCPEGSPSAVLCHEGTFRATVGASTASDCVPCPSGNMCPKGTFDPKPCPAGSFASSTGAALCTLCPAGKANALTEQAECVACAPGMYTTPGLEGRLMCSPCAPGTFNEHPGATSCKLCTPGKSAPQQGSPTCTACGAGFYQDQFGTNLCKACPVGKAVASNGSIECVNCELGKRMPFEGRASCELCERGKTQAVAGQATCEPCPAGETSPQGHTEPQCRSCGLSDPGAQTSSTAGGVYGAFAPHGIACPNGALLGTLAGHWAEEYLTDDNVYQVRAYPCPVAAACEGGLDSRCRVGHTGRLCLSCATGLVPGSNGLCVDPETGSVPDASCEVGANGLCAESGVLVLESPPVFENVTTSVLRTRVVNTTKVKTLLSLDANLAHLQTPSSRTQLANNIGGAYGISAFSGRVAITNVTAGSVIVQVAITVDNQSAAESLVSTILAVNNSVLSTATGYNTSRLSAPETVVESTNVPFYELVTTLVLVKNGTYVLPAGGIGIKGGLELYGALLVLLASTFSIGFLIVFVAFCCLSRLLPRPDADALSALSKEEMRRSFRRRLSSCPSIPLKAGTHAGASIDSAPSKLARISFAVQEVGTSLVDTATKPGEAVDYQRRGAKPTTSPTSLPVPGNGLSADCTEPSGPLAHRGGTPSAVQRFSRVEFDDDDPETLTTEPASPSIDKVTTKPLPPPTRPPVSPPPSPTSPVPESPAPMTPISPTSAHPPTRPRRPRPAYVPPIFVHREPWDVESRASFRHADSFAEALVSELTETYGLRACAIEGVSPGQHLATAPLCIFCLNRGFFDDDRSVDLLKSAVKQQKPLLFIVMPGARWGRQRDLDLPDNATNQEARRLDLSDNAGGSMATRYYPELRGVLDGKGVDEGGEIIFWELEYNAACFTDVLTVIIAKLGDDAEWYLDIGAATLKLSEAENNALAAAALVKPSNVVLTRRWDGENAKKYDVYLCHKLDEREDVALALYNGLSSLHFKPFLGRLDLQSVDDIEAAIAQCGSFIILLSPYIIDSYWCACELRAAIKLHERGAIDLLLVPLQRARFYPDAVGMSGDTVGCPTGEMMMKNFEVWFPELALAERQSILRLFGGGTYTASRLVQHSSTHYKAFERVLAARLGMSMACRLQVKRLLSKQSPKALANAEVIRWATQLVQMVDEANCLQQQLGAPSRYSIVHGKATSAALRASDFLRDALKLHIVQAVDSATIKRVASRLDRPDPNTSAANSLELHVVEILAGSTLFVKPLSRRAASSSTKRATEMAAAMDTDGSGTIDYAELVAFAAQAKQERDDDQTMRAIAIEDFPRVVRLLRLRAEENDAVPPTSAPLGAPASLVRWAKFHKELDWAHDNLADSSIPRQMLIPVTALAKVVLGYAQVGGSIIYTFAAPAVEWPNDFVLVSEYFAWSSIEAIFSADLVHSFRFLDIERARSGKAVRDFVAEMNYVNTTFAFLLSICVFFISLPSSAYLLTHLSNQRYLREALVDHAVTIAVWTSFLVYPGVCMRVLSLYVPRDLAGALVLQKDPRLEYEELLWARLYVIPFTVLLLIGIPVVLGSRMLMAYRRSKQPLVVETPAAREERAYELRRDRMKYGILDALYSRNCWWWEAYELLRKLLLVGVLLTILPGTALQVWVAVLLCLSALCITIFVNPFTNGKLNALNFISMACLLFIVTSGLGYHKHYAVGHEAAIENVEWLLPDVLVALLCAPLVAALFVIYLIYLDASAYRAEALAAYAELPVPLRDEVPPEITARDERRKREEFRRRHAHAMGRSMDTKEAREADERERREERKAARKASLVGVGDTLLGPRATPEMVQPAKAGAGGTDSADAALQPPPIPSALEEVSAMVERSLLGTHDGKRVDGAAGTLRVTLDDVGIASDAPCQA